MSIDVGYVNLAYSEFGYSYLSKVKKRIELRDWKLLDANVSSEYNVQSYATQGRQLLDNGLWSSDEPTLYLMERQSLRPIGFKRSVPHAIIKLVAFEALLFGMLQERCYTAANNSSVECISPTSVSNHWNLTSDSYKSKKGLGQSIVLDWMKAKDAPLRIPSRLAKYYEITKKKDDLTDSLLIGLAFLQWLGHGVKLTANSKLSKEIVIASRNPAKNAENT